MGLFSECFDSIVIKLTYGDKLMTVVLTEMLIYHISVTIFLLDFLNTSRYTPQKSFNLSEDLDTARVLKPKQVVVFLGRRSYPEPLIVLGHLWFRFILGQCKWFTILLS